MEENEWSRVRAKVHEAYASWISQRITFGEPLVIYPDTRGMELGLFLYGEENEEAYPPDETFISINIDNFFDARSVVPRGFRVLRYQESIFVEIDPIEIHFSLLFAESDEKEFDLDFPPRESLWWKYFVGDTFIEKGGTASMLKHLRGNKEYDKLTEFKVVFTELTLIGKGPNFPEGSIEDSAGEYQEKVISALNSDEEGINSNMFKKYFTVRHPHLKDGSLANFERWYNTQRAKTQGTDEPSFVSPYDEALKWVFPIVNINHC